MAKLIDIKNGKDITPQKKPLREIEKVISLDKKRGKQDEYTEECIRIALREQIGLGDAPSLKQRKWFNRLEIDGDILYFLDEESWKCGALQDIEAKAFVGTKEYESVRKFLDKMSAQQLFDYLLSLIRTHITAPQVQAIQDEIDERSNRKS